MKVIGHRGARGLAPENTIAGLERAIEYGVDMVEVDLRVTRDGVAVLHHDPAVVDPDGSEIIISRTTYAELLRHKSDLAALDHAIRAIQHRCGIMIEIKPGVSTKQTVAVIKDRLHRGWQLNEFAVASYDFAVLSAIRHAFPLIELVVLERWSGVRASHRARSLGTKRISMNQRWLWVGFLKAVHNSGYQLTPYTVNNPLQAKKWQPYLYGIITDRPDLFKRKK